MKAVIILLSSILTICIFAFYGFKAFVSSIKNQRTCEWANIDNIELHAHIDVPKVTKWDCRYDKESNTKMASFTIDKQNLNLSQYIQTYKFEKLPSNTDVEYDRFLNMEKDSLVSSELYYKKNPLNAEHYEVLLDKITGRLWVTIKYSTM